MSVIRTVRRRTTALIAVVAFAAAGCAGTTGASSGQQHSEADIDSSAVLKFSSAAPLRLLDPVSQPSYGPLGYLALLYDRLTMVDTNSKIVPGLATKWQFAEDGSYLELTLRSDVTFHDGTPFDAAAVKANIERGKTDPDSTVVDDLADVTAVEVVNPTTARLMLTKGTGAQLPSVLATNVGMMVSPKAIADGVDIGNAPGDAGSGPYVMTEFVPEEKLVVKRAAEYWDPKAGRLAGIELERVPEATTRLNGVQTGKTDLSYVSSANDIANAKQLADKGQLNYHGLTFRNLLGVYLRADQGDLVKPEVRQAIARAIDPKEVNALFSGTCEPHRQLYPNDDWSAIADYEYPYAFDKAEAERLVQQAGGASVTITFAAGTNAEQPANVVQGALAAVGIDTKLNPVPNSASEPRFIAGDFEMLVATSFSPKIDPAETVSTYLLGGYNLAADPSLVQEAATRGEDPTLPQAERAPLFQEIWRTTLEQAWYVPLCRMTNAAVFGDRVMYADTVPWADLGIWDLRNVAMAKAS